MEKSLIVQEEFKGGVLGTEGRSVDAAGDESVGDLRGHVRTETLFLENKESSVTKSLIWLLCLDSVIPNVVTSAT